MPRRLVALQLALLVCVAAATVDRFPVWALVDERAHYAYVQTVAEERRLPWLGRDLVSPEAHAVDANAPPPQGLTRQSYEAFQPPLYYVLAAPLFAAVDGYAAKARALRVLGAVFLLAAAGLTWLLCVRALGRARAPAGFAVALTVLLWPGVVTRTVTISNTGLELVLSLTALVLLWDAHARRDGRRLIAAGAVVGLALATRLTAVVLLAPLLAVAWRIAGRAAAIAAALPALVLAPWLLSNLDRYGALTAGERVRAMQEPELNPSGREYGVADLRAGLARLLNGVLAEEWWSQFLDVSKRRLRDAFMLLVLAAPPALAIWRPPPDLARALVLCVAPLAMGVGLMAAGLFAGNWDFFLPRYLHGVLPAYAAFAGVAVVHALGERAACWVAAGFTLALAVLWALLATVTPFTP